MMVLGLDTSNYTTSIAAFDGTDGTNCSRLLDVKQGELGLRQSDALFSHVKRLPELADRLFDSIDPSTIRAIGVSTQPRAVKGSYMPCFLAGQSQARVLGRVLDVPVYSFSHQQGHIAASVWSAGRMDLLEKPHLAWHLSGGTTELLLVEPDGLCVTAQRIGGTMDLSAGQLIDRTGQLLGTAFPAGKTIDALARQSETRERFKVRLHHELEFSLSGVQNQVQQYFGKTNDPAAAARFCLQSAISAVQVATEAARKQYPGLEVVFSGGVASNSLLRQQFPGAVFCAPEFSTDNAMGIAVLTWRQGV